MNASRITSAVPSRVDGVCLRSPYTRFGFSPSADFTLTASEITCSSTVRPPHVLSATDCPPIGLPDPGLTTTDVTPPLSASRKPSSSMLMASMARTAAALGVVISLVSFPADALALLVQAHVPVRLDEARGAPTDRSRR